MFADLDIDPQELLDLGIYVIQTKGWATILGVSAAALALVWMFGARTVKFGVALACWTAGKLGRAPLSVLAQSLQEAFKAVDYWEKDGSFIKCPQRQLQCKPDATWITVNGKGVCDDLTKREKRILRKLAATVNACLHQKKLLGLAAIVRRPEEANGVYTGSGLLVSGTYATPDSNEDGIGAVAIGDDYKIGDAVVLNSGGPRMTVAGIRPDGKVVCVWDWGTDQPKTGSFNPASLTTATEYELTCASIERELGPTPDKRIPPQGGSGTAPPRSGKMLRGGTNR